MQIKRKLKKCCRTIQGKDLFNIKPNSIRNRTSVELDECVTILREKCKYDQKFQRNVLANQKIRKTICFFRISES